MNYCTLWTWNPSSTHLSHDVTHHSRPNEYTDASNEWGAATSVLHKNLEHHD